MPTGCSRSPMLVVCRKISRRTASATSARTSTDSVCAGRPFFIRIGVSQASLRAGVEQRGDRTRPEPRVEVVDVGLDQQRVRRRRRRPARRPAAAARWCDPAGSRPPAPSPIAVAVIAGCAPEPVALAASSAAPVGVHSSSSTGPPYDGRPRSSSATAGAGTGSRPCAVPTWPPPTRDGRDTTSVSRAEVLQPGAGADHVGDRVEGADLVEVHLVGGGAVDGRLGLGEPGEGPASRGRARRSVRSARSSRCPDVGPGAVVRRSRRSRP